MPCGLSPRHALPGTRRQALNPDFRDLIAAFNGEGVEYLVIR
jgi:hypothetical protein